MNNFNLKKYLAEGRLLEDDGITYALHITTVEYDNGKMGYMYEVVDLDTEEEVGSEFGFKPLYFIGSGDENDQQVFRGKDFNSIKTSGMYQDEVIDKEMALYIYNGLLKGDDFYGDKISFDPRELAPLKEDVNEDSSFIRTKEGLEQVFQQMLSGELSGKEANDKISKFSFGQGSMGIYKDTNKLFLRNFGMSGGDYKDYIIGDFENGGFTPAPQPKSKTALKVWNYLSNI